MTNLLAAFATAAFRFIPSANRIIGSIQNVRLYNEYIAFIASIKPAEPVDLDEGTDIEDIKSLSLNNVSFFYTNTPVLNNVSIHMQAGSITGLSGPSGVGKTTLINIISGLLEPKAGSILLNNKEVTPVIKTALQHKSAYVMQEPFFLTGSISDNIVFGYDEHPDLQKVNWCLKSVNLDKWTQQQPNGLNTEIGDNGTKLSGGQKQRLAIARALYRKASIFILDEPSNSLDGFNKQEILLLVKQLTLQNKLITIIVSHDADVLKICDTVVELKK